MMKGDLLKWNECWMGREGLYAIRELFTYHPWFSRSEIQQ